MHRLWMVASSSAQGVPEAGQPVTGRRRWCAKSLDVSWGLSATLYTYCTKADIRWARGQRDWNLRQPNAGVHLRANQTIASEASNPRLARQVQRPSACAVVIVRVGASRRT